MRRSLGAVLVTCLTLLSVALPAGGVCRYEEVLVVDMEAHWELREWWVCEEYPVCHLEWEWVWVPEQTHWETRLVCADSPGENGPDSQAP